MTADNAALRANGMLVLLGRGAGAPAAGETRSEDELSVRPAPGIDVVASQMIAIKAIAIMDNAGSQRV